MRFKIFTTLFALLMVSYSCQMMKKGKKMEEKKLLLGDRKTNPQDIKVPDGYTVQVVAENLNFPTATTFDDAGNLYVIEAGFAYKPEWEVPQLIRIEANGNKKVIARGDRNGPWNGLIFHQGNFYVAEGGTKKGGKIIRISQDGKITDVVSGLPSFGDHHTNGPAIGPDGYLYFSQGVATNSGVVGKDNWMMGWLSDHKDFHDIPCKDITLTGQNFVSDNMLSENPNNKATTGAFSPFNSPTTAGQVIKGQIPCSGAVFRVRPEGGALELVAWGLRNPYGLAFHEGRLFVTENGFDARGSRPVITRGDHLWEIKPGTWYGWPDFDGGDPLRAAGPGDEAPAALLTNYPQLPPKPLATFGMHSSSNGIAFAPNNAFGQAGKAFVAQFGDMTPMTGSISSRIGFKVVAVDPATGQITEFAANKGPVNGPAEAINTHGFERPVSVTFSPDGSSLYVVDLGTMYMTPMGPNPKQNSGVIWKITRR